MILLCWGLRQFVQRHDALCLDVKIIGLTFVDYKIVVSQQFQDGGSFSEWYQRFTAEYKSRMRSMDEKNLALDIKLILKVLDVVDENNCIWRREKQINWAK